MRSPHGSRPMLHSTGPILSKMHVSDGPANAKKPESRSSYAIGDRVAGISRRTQRAALMVFIDDATGRLMHLQFVESESTFSYFHATRAYLEAWGKPVAFYSDKHGVFRVNHEGAIGGDGMTQFGRALDAL